MSRLETVWNPWQEMNRLRREMEGLFGNSFSEQGPSGRFPVVNVWEKEGALVLSTEIPGIDASRLNVSLEKDSLTLSGERTEAKPSDEQNYVRRERWFGAFQRTIELPFDVDPDKCDASYEKGILTIKLQRAPEQEPKKLQIKAG